MVLVLDRPETTNCPVVWFFKTISNVTNLKDGNINGSHFATQNLNVIKNRDQAGHKITY